MPLFAPNPSRSGWSRARRGAVSEWWWTVDRWLLATALLLLATGFLLSLSASPAATHRLRIDDSFHFVARHAVFLGVASAVLIATSFLTPRWVRRGGIVLCAAMVAALLLLPFFGYATKGAMRWYSLGPFLFQPSEFLKPAFAVTSAFLFAEAQRRPDMPANALCVALFGMCFAMLVMQPDMGQSILLFGIWGTMFFMAGMPWLWIAVFGALGAVGGLMAYLSVDHFAQRIDRFVTGAGDTFQVDRGLEAIRAGGWVGRGPGEGQVKYGLPDGHTDFVYAVAGEEFGILFAAALACGFAFVVLRGLAHAMRERDRFVQLSVAGLVLAFGFQAIINIGVNLQLLPAKGMTLPLISYGGSSMVAVAFGLGLVLALTRRRSEHYRRAVLGHGMGGVRIGPSALPSALAQG